MVHQLFS